MQLPYTGQTSYELDLGGLSLSLPVVRVAPGLHIASFVLLGNVTLANHCARLLADRLRGVAFDYLVCPEAKVLPLAQSLCTELGLAEYVVLRKDAKGYMVHPMEADVQSITTRKLQHLVIDGPDADKLRGKRVVFLDDVVSTGGTFHAMEKLLEPLGVRIVAYAAALREGDGFSDPALIHLGELPTFPGGD